MNTNKKTAEIAVMAYLVTIMARIVAMFLLRFKFLPTGDSPLIAKRFMVSEWKFRKGSASDIIVLACDTAVALTLHFLLKPVNRSLVLLAAIFRLVHTAIDGIILSCRIFVMLPFLGTDCLTISEPAKIYTIRKEPFPGLRKQILVG